MAKNLDKALDNTEMTYSDLIEIANDMSVRFFTDINTMINNLQSKLYSLSNEDLRLAIIDLSLKSFSLSEMKDKAILKQEIAETLRKEKYSQTFNLTDGTVGFKDNTAILESSEQILVELIYDYVASAFKTKLDEVHRVVDSLKTILMSKMQEMKITNNTMEV